MTVKRLRQHIGSAVIVCSLSFLLSGCVNNSYWVWEHEEVKSQSLLLKSQQECRKLARQEADQFNYYFHYADFPLYWPRYDRQRVHRSYWGWSNHYRFLRWQDDYDRFFHLCMRAKGWSLNRKVIEADQEPDSTQKPD